MKDANIRIVRPMSTLAVCIASLTITCAALAAPVTVTVTVTTAGGAPIADAPIEVGSDTEADFGFTDESGIVTFTIELSPDDPDIIARLWSGAYHSDLTAKERILAQQRYTEIPKDHHFEPRYFAQTTPGQTEYQIDIVAQPSIEITGRLINTQGVSLPDDYFAIAVRDSAWFGEFLNTEGIFTVHGVRRGATAELLTATGEGIETHSIVISEENTQQNIDIGNITIEYHDLQVPMDMNIMNYDSLYDAAGVALWDHVSLIRSDSQALLTFPVKPPEGEVVAKVAEIQTDVPRTTSGTYYIAPGPIAAPTALALLDAIRAGDHAALDAAGVPKFTAVQGQTTHFTLDAAQARDAILAATRQAP